MYIYIYIYRDIYLYNTRTEYVKRTRIPIKELCARRHFPVTHPIYDYDNSLLARRMGKISMEIANIIMTSFHNLRISPRTYRKDNGLTFSIIDTFSLVLACLRKHGNCIVKNLSFLYFPNYSDKSINLVL